MTLVQILETLTRQVKDRSAKTNFVLTSEFITKPSLRLAFNWMREAIRHATTRDRSLPHRLVAGRAPFLKSFTVYA